mgnify:FL=1
MPPDNFNQEALNQAHIDIAVLKVELAGLRRDVDNLTTAVRTLADAFSTVNLTLSEAKGGWKLMMLLGGGAATFGSLITWALTHIERQRRGA